MEFKDIADFDAWLLEPDNFERILPFPRCVIAFQVRRETKYRRLAKFIDILSLAARERADKSTFLYIRNGERLYRLETQIDFGKQLFPDTDHWILMSDQKLWWRDGNFVTDATYQEEMRRSQALNAQVEVLEAAFKEWLAAHPAPDDEEPEDPSGEEPDYGPGVDRGGGWTEYPTESEEHKAWRAVHSAWVARHAEWQEKRTAYWQAKNAQDDPIDALRWKARFAYSGWSEVTNDSVHFDDAARDISKAIQHHNRIMVVLQGLFDRSEVFHPHPGHSIWTEDGFHRAVEFVYDVSKALAPGEAPDFEAYAADLRLSIAVGSVVIGAEKAWLKHEAENERNRRASRNRHYDEEGELIYYRPYGNPGPGYLAKVASISRDRKTATFRWERERSGPARDDWGKRKPDKYPCSIKVPVAELFHVSAYKPGDFKRFYADPRTRANYVRWAPLLLESEEYHAGNRKVGKPDE